MEGGVINNLLVIMIVSIKYSLGLDIIFVRLSLLIYNSPTTPFHQHSKLETELGDIFYVDTGSYLGGNQHTTQKHTTNRRGATKGKYLIIYFSRWCCGGMSGIHSV